MPRKTTTPKEYVERLEETLSRRTRLDQEEALRQEGIRQYRILQSPIIEELKREGYDVESLYALRNIGRPYKAAVPILLKWLPQVEDWHLKDSIVRALSVPWAKPAALLPLIVEFRTAAGPTIVDHVKWAIGNALSIIADDTVFDDVADLVQEKRHGRSREMLAVALGRMKDPRAVDLLIKLLDDEEVAGHALIAIRKLKAREAASRVEPFLNHPKAWVRSEAKKALARITKLPR
jgi:hypothetical protein